MGYEIIKDHLRNTLMEDGDDLEEIINNLDEMYLRRCSEILSYTENDEQKDIELARLSNSGSPNSAFTWSSSPQGRMYWERIQNKYFRGMSASSIKKKMPPPIPPRPARLFAVPEDPIPREDIADGDIEIDGDWEW